jgi:hypothetical protein
MLAVSGSLLAVYWYHDWNPRRREIRYQIRTNLANADASTLACYWADAQISIDRARLALSNDPSLFQSSEIRYFNWRIDRADVKLEERQRKASESATNRGCPGVLSEIDDTQAIDIRKNTVGSLSQTMGNLLQQEKCDEAAQFADQILILDPANSDAAAVAEICHDGLGIPASN